MKDQAVAERRLRPRGAVREGLVAVVFATAFALPQRHDYGAPDDAGSVAKLSDQTVVVRYLILVGRADAE